MYGQHFQNAQLSVLVKWELKPDINFAPIKRLSEKKWNVKEASQERKLETKVSVFSFIVFCQIHLTNKTLLQSELFCVHSKRTQCLKITEKVAFKIASEASYVYILSGQKLIEIAQKWSIFCEFFKNLKLAVK